MSTPNKAKRQRPAMRIWLALATLIIVLDQASKFWFNSKLHYAERLQVLPFFDFTLLYNTGAAFSFLADGQGWQRWFFITVALAAIILILNLLYRQSGQKLFCTSLSLILGGAAGNVIDRIIFGHVTDFLLFYWNGWYFPAFNIADIAISCGAALLILDEIIRIRRAKRARS